MAKGTIPPQFTRNPQPKKGKTIPGAPFPGKGTGKGVGIGKSAPAGGMPPKKP